MMYSLEMLTKKRKFGRFGRSILVDLVDRPAKNPRKIDQIDQIARVVPPKIGSFLVTFSTTLEGSAGRQGPGGSRPLPLATGLDKCPGLLSGTLL